MINAVSSANPNQNSGGGNTASSVPPAPAFGASPPQPTPADLSSQATGQPTFANSLAEKVNASSAINNSIPPIPPPPGASGNLNPISPGSDGGNGGNSSDDSGGKNTKSFAKRFSPKMIVGAVLLFLLILGSGAGLYLSQQSQDLRQQADVNCSRLTEAVCNASNNGCVWNEYQRDIVFKCKDLSVQECERGSFGNCSVYGNEPIQQNQGIDPFCDGPDYTLPLNTEWVRECIPGDDASDGGGQSGDDGTPPGGDTGTTAMASCEAGGNQIPHGGTACNAQDRTREFVCNNGSWVPGNSCGSGSCQGTSCTGGGGGTSSCNGSMCNATCASDGLSCSISCQSGSGCQTFRKTFVCEGRRSDGCPPTVDINELHKSNDASIDPSDSRYWCKTVQLDAHAAQNAESGAQSSNASVIYIGDGGDYCRDGDTNCINNLDWDCANEPVMACNSACTTDAQCSAVNSNYRCLPTFSFGANDSFQNPDQAFLNGISRYPGTLTSLSTFIHSDGQPRQQIVKGGRVYGRFGFDNNGWRDYTNDYGLPSTTNITSFSSYQNASGTVVQHAVVNGQIWYRSGTTGAWIRINPRNSGGENEPRLNLPSQATGTITHYSVMKWGSIVDQRVVIGGQVWYRHGTPAPEGRFSNWENVTGYLVNGTGNITSYVNHIDQQGHLRQHYVRNGQLWFRVNNNQGNKCRLAQSPNSASCNIAPPPPPPPPSDDKLKCDDSCSVNIINPGADQCAIDLGPAYSCINSRCRLTANPLDASCQPAQEQRQCNSDCTTNAQCQHLGDYTCFQNKCRLRDNPTSTQCQPATPVACNQICNPSATGNQAGACATGLTCHQTGTTPNNEPIHRCRLASNLNNPACTAAPLCASIRMNIVESQSGGGNQSGSERIQIGDTVNFTCGLVDGADRYSFRVTVPGASPSPLPVSRTQPNVSENLRIDTHGTYQARCFLFVDYTQTNGGSDDDSAPGGGDDDDTTTPPGVCGRDYNCEDIISCADGELAACSANGGCRCAPRPNVDRCQQASDCTNVCQSGQTKVCRASTCGCINTGRGSGGGGGNNPGPTPIPTSTPPIFDM